MQLIFRVIQFSMCFRAFYTVLIKTQPLTTRSFPRHFIAERAQTICQSELP